MQRVSDVDLPNIRANSIIANVSATSAINVLRLSAVELSAHANRFEVEEESGVNCSIMDMASREQDGAIDG